MSQGLHGLCPFSYDPWQRNVGTRRSWLQAVPLQWPLHDTRDLWHQTPNWAVSASLLQKFGIEGIAAVLQSWWSSGCGQVRARVRIFLGRTVQIIHKLSLEMSTCHRQKGRSMRHLSEFIGEKIPRDLMSTLCDNTLETFWFQTQNTHINRCSNTKNQGPSQCQPWRQCRHPKLSIWQTPVSPATIKPAPWQLPALNKGSF